MDKQTNRQTNRQTENSKPEATLIPVDRRGERANIFTKTCFNSPFQIDILCEDIVSIFNLKNTSLLIEMTIIVIAAINYLYYHYYPYCI